MSQPGDDTDHRLAAARSLMDLWADLLEQNGYRRPATGIGPVRDLERLMRIDGRTPDQVERVIRWLATGRDPVAQFWQPNVRTPRKLREHWDTMAAQVKRERARTLPGNAGSAVDRIRQANTGA